ncbi:DM13 domain-containing protein [Buchananella hordeovulneris]|nr:DM13 domain-containing protein [Buchananella hordeovulneris]
MRKKKWMIIGAIGSVALIVALVLFQPWLLFIDKRVDDALPTVATRPSAAVSPSAPGAATASSSPVPTDAATPAPSTPAPQDSEPAPSEEVAREVAAGTFISHEHDTSGRASIVRLPDGSHQLVFENLSTSLGPDVRVWLSAGPVVEGRDGWFTAADHPHLDVAPLKGNLGNQVYDLPADFDPAQWPTVDLWCEDFSVSFGAAALEPVA